jgi:hypothetical protein
LFLHFVPLLQQDHAEHFEKAPALAVQQQDCWSSAPTASLHAK